MQKASSPRPHDKESCLELLEQPTLPRHPLLSLQVSHLRRATGQSSGPLSREGARPRLDFECGAQACPLRAARGVGSELDSAWLVESPAQTLATALTSSREDLGQGLGAAAFRVFPLAPRTLTTGINLL